MQLLGTQFLFLQLNLLASLGIAQLQVFLLLVVRLLLAIVGEDLLLLPLEFLSGLQLSAHELLLLECQLGQCFLHVTFFGEVLSLYFSFALLYFEELGVFGLGLQAD